MDLNIFIQIRDRVFQPISDWLVRSFGVGPFGISAALLRSDAVISPALAVAAFLTTHEVHPLGWAFDLLACACSYSFSTYPAVAARKPPRGGLATASALRGDDWMSFGTIILLLFPWGLYHAIAEGTVHAWFQLGSTALFDVGFMLGTTLWRDLARRESKASLALAGSGA